MSETKQGDAPAAEQWETQYESTAAMHYICSTKDGQPVVDFGFEYQKEAQAFCDAHNAALATASSPSEDTKRLDWLDSVRKGGQCFASITDYGFAVTSARHQNHGSTNVRAAIDAVMASPSVTPEGKHVA